MSTGVTSTRLLERDGELERIARALDAARAGEGAGLVLVGEAGIGKTALLHAAQAAASDATLLRARGAALERDYGYGVVRQLLDGVVRDPRRRAELLVGPAAFAAAALGFGGGAAEPGQDPTFAAFHGLFWLLNGLAEERPVVLVVDDAHWADLVSLRFLVYAARRLHGLALTLLMAWREPEPDVPDAILEELRSVEAISEVRPAPLTLAAARALVGDVGDAEALHRASGGNPFYLAETIRASASGEQLVSPEAVRRQVGTRLQRLGPMPGAIAEAVAVLGGEAALRHAAAVAGLPVPEAQRAADTLAAGGLLTGERPLRFTHPVLRAAVEDRLAAGELAAAHRRAADVLAADDPDRAATHLLATDPSGDERTAARLLAAAQRAVDAGAPESGVRFAVRALAEPPHERFAALLLLGRAQREAGDPAAAETFAAAAEAASTAAGRVAALRGRAGSLVAFNRIPDAVRTLDRAIAELHDGDPELRREVEADLLLSGLFENELANDLSGRAERAVRGLGTDTPASRRLWICAAFVRMHHGVGTAQESIELLLRGMPEPSSVREHPADVPGPEAALGVIGWTDDLDLLWSRIEALEEHSRATAAVLHIVCAAGWRSYAHYLAGELAAGEAAGWEALALTPQARFPTATPIAATPLLFNLVAQGKLDAADEVLAVVDVDGPMLANTLMGLWFETARAEVLLQQGKLDALRDVLERTSQGVAARGGAPVSTAMPYALAATGDRELARVMSQANLERCRCWGSVRMLAQALILEATLAPDRVGDLLGEAVDVLEGTPFRLDLARALLAHGAHLRRGRERVAARSPLTRALDLATRCGAQPLVEEATTELLACGARPRRQLLSGLDSLTPSELRIATLAAHGRTNAQIAQTLFVTRSTVETHLSSVYRKLDVRSRAELPARLHQ